MPLVNFTNLDFDQIKTSIKSYLRSNSNFTDYDFEGSNLSTIVDVLAYNTYISSYNANMVSNEVFIDSATLRENVVSLARNIGYVPRSRTAARSAITFTVDTTDFTTNPTAITLKKGVVASTSAFGGDSYTFAIPEDITVPVVDGVATFDSIDIFEGEFLVDNFTVEAENPAPPQKYILSNPHIDTSTLRVLVRDTESSTTSRNFLLSDSLFEVTGDSRVYFIQEIEDQRYELIFGDGIFGEKLEELNFIEVSYIRTSGEEANGLSNFSFSGILVDNNNVSVADGISLITTITASESGKEIESVDSVKNYATKIYASQNRAFVTDKAESLVKVVDLNDFRIISEIETGDGTSPGFIINKLDKAFVLNGGSAITYDSTLITITYKDNLIPLADFSGNLGCLPVGMPRPLSRMVNVVADSRIKSIRLACPATASSIALSRISAAR